MGSTRFNAAAYSMRSATLGYADPTVSHTSIYSSTDVKRDYDPAHIVTRESRDSVANPKSNAIILALDCTGSMGPVLKRAVAGLGTLIQEIYSRKPVTDPHVMAMFLDDVTVEPKPLQMTQFEADGLDTQLTELYLTQNGGGNKWESYNLPWYAAARKTSIDCWEKRKKKGYLFTIGDEQPPDDLTPAQIKKVFGITESETDLSNEDLLNLVSQKYEVFHLIVAQGAHASVAGPKNVQAMWQDLLGQRAVLLTDINALAETIVSLIQVNEGHDKEAVIGSWSGTTAVAVREAVKDLVAKDSGSEGVTVY